MDKLDKQWLVFEAFGVNFPWKDIKDLSEEDLDYLHNNVEGIKGELVKIAKLSSY